MSLVATVTSAFERLPLPDTVSRLAVSALVGRTHRRLAGLPSSEEAAFAGLMATYPIAEHTDLANDQHYALPPEFFALMLGPRRKYSCCLYADPGTTLAQAEEAALAETAAHAGLADGQSILELGCGWGSLSLWMAERYPAARITALSNAGPQRLHIEAQARARGLRNLQVVTADMNDYAATTRFDRIVSIEMFEHMANWRALLGRLRDWLLPDGRVFVHVFAHASAPYRFDRDDKDDWIAQHFFTGGIMPSHGLMRRFPDLFDVEADWRWNGRHYARTALDWLARLDAERLEVETVLRRTYGAAAAPLWHRRWRLFLMATAGLFGHADGEAWGVSHYRLRPAGRV